MRCSVDVGAVIDGKLIIPSPSVFHHEQKL